MDWTKTIQFGERQLLTPLIPIEGSILCPVKAYLNMCHLIKAKPEEPSFTLGKKQTDHK